MIDKEKEAMTTGALMGFVFGVVAGMAIMLCVTHASHTAASEPRTCHESAYTLDGHDSVGATCPVGTRLTMHSESRALCLCPRP